MGKEENKSPQKELTHDSILDPKMKKNDYLKIFKKTATWRNKKAVLFIAKHQFANGKMPLVAIPYKKIGPLNSLYNKTLKSLFKVNSRRLIAEIVFEKGQDGNMTARVVPVEGGLNLDYAEAYGKELFANLKMNFDIKGEQGELDVEDMLEVMKTEEDEKKEQAGEPVEKKKMSPEELAELAETVKQQKRRNARLERMLENVSKFEQMKGREDEVLKKLEEYKQQLESIKIEANADGKISPEEEKQIKELEEAIQLLETELNKERPKIRKLTPVRRKKIEANLTQIEHYLDQVLKTANA